MIPVFVEDTGYLPPGVHDATFDEFQQRFTGTLRRLHLMEGLRRVLSQLYAAGVEDVYLGGSYCTAAPFPNDVDGYWVYRSGIDISKIDPVILQMAAVVIDPISGRAIRAMKLKYGVEFFMDSPNVRIQGMTCEEFFSHSRDGVQRGVVHLRKEDGI